MYLAEVWAQLAQSGELNRMRKVSIVIIFITLFDTMDLRPIVVMIKVIINRYQSDTMYWKCPHATDHQTLKIGWRLKLATITIIGSRSPI